MKMWSFHDGCVDLKFGMGIAIVWDLTYFWSSTFVVDFLLFLNCGLSNAFGHPYLQLMVLANHLDHCSTYGVVGLMRVVGCFMWPYGGRLHLSWLDELMETMAICAHDCYLQIRLMLVTFSDHALAIFALNNFVVSWSVMSLPSFMVSKEFAFDGLCLREIMPWQIFYGCLPHLACCGRIWCLYIALIASKLSCNDRSLNKIFRSSEFCLILDLLTTFIVHFMWWSNL